MPPEPPPARRLLILRHAKAGPHDDAHDHARDLDPRAGAQLAAVAAFMHARALVPDRVLLSDAVRTRRTWELLAPGLALGRYPPVELSARLYLAEATELLSALRALPDDARTPLLVGHNPGVHALVIILAGRERAAAAGLAAGMPTATLAVLDLPGDGTWSALGPAGIGACTAFRP